MKQADAFNPSFFKLLKEAEEKHFWFQIRRKWIFDKIKKYIPPPAKLLEIGCGTGNVSSFLAQKGYIVAGCEYYQEAINIAWPGIRIVQGNTYNLPFENNSFDIVGLFDVIEHFQDDISSLREAFRVVRDGGIIAVTVPARDELWSWFDEISLHKRRYTKNGLKQVLSESQLSPVLVEYMFMSLYIPMKCMRSKGEKNTDPFRINKSVNALLAKLFNVERIISKGLPLPIGTSLIAIAHKGL